MKRSSALGSVSDSSRASIVRDTLLLASSCSSGSGESAGMEREERPLPPHASVPVAASQLICNPLRTMVSQNRRRYHDDGFNLDLTYITDRIIAMGYPADTKEALYRNSMHSIVQFLEYNHPGHYKVFNLRGQYVYDTSKFHNRVLSFEMVDHHPPRLEIMAPFCREVHEYLAEDPRNVVAVHCKAGKGRTGVMICAYLCYINFYPLPRQNMDYYSIVRTHNNKGVTIPSQRRYVYYFAHLRSKRLNYMPLRVELVGIFLERPPRQSSFPRKAIEVRVVNGDVDVFRGEGMNLSKEEWDEEEAAWGKGVVSKGEDTYDPHESTGSILSRRGYGWTVPSDRRVFLEGDVRIELLSSFTNHMKAVKQLKNKIGHCWFNTMFTCPSYCGGTYTHGDEAYPYPPGETTITVRRGKMEMRPKSGSASVPSSPPSSPKNGNASISGRRAPSFDAKKTRTPRLSQINNAFKKIADGVASRNSSDASVSERGRANRVEIASEGGESDDELMLLRPPGLDEHCSKDSLNHIYGPLKKIPPRVKIEQMLRDAHSDNLMSDVYNERRLSVPQEGKAVECSPEGRPRAGGPKCIVKESDEHVTVFNVLEMDDACKNKEIHPAFKMMVVTRCIRERGSEQRLADKFLEVTREKQSVKDKKKRERVEARQRKLHSAGSNPGPDVTADEVCGRKEGEGEDDPRINHPYFKTFFYRQRSTSLSHYPPFYHRCPLHSIPSSSHDATPSSEHPVDVKRMVVEGERSDPCDWQLPPSTDSSSDLDVEVRSYHPEEDKWNHSATSASSSSSEGATIGPSLAPVATTSTVSAPALLPS